MMRNSDTDSIYQACERFISDWNKANVKDLSELFSNEGIRVGIFGEVSQGKREIEAMYNVIINKALLGSKLEYKKGIVRIVAQDIATWAAPFHAVNPSGDEPLNGFMVNILRKENGRWLILESHPKIFPKV